MQKQVDMSAASRRLGIRAVINSIRLKSLGAFVVLVLGIAAPPAEAQTQSADQVRKSADQVRKSADQVRKSADQVRKSADQARRDNDMWIGPRCSLSPSIWNSIEVGDPEKAGVRVWWQASSSRDEALAKQIADASQNAIIPAVLEVLGRFPTDSGGICGGRSKALDVALVAETGESPAKTTGDDGNCGTSSYIEVNRAHLNLRTVAHEIFHAATNTYKVAARCSSYDWLAEATAVWFEDYVTSEQYGFKLEPKFEHVYAEDLLNNPQVSLEKVRGGGGTGYGSYLLPYFVSQCPAALWQSDASITQCDSKDPLVVRRIWEGTQRLDALHAVDAALPGGFGSVWKDFVIANWNVEPLAPPPPYRQWSPSLRLISPARERIDVTLNGEESARRALPAAVDHLASRYYQLKFTDARVRYFQFQNPFSAGKDPAAAVQAIYSLKDGTRKFEDWTARPDVTFCRDRAAEDVTEIVLVFSNSSIEPGHTLSPTTTPLLAFADSCPGATITGTIKHSHEMQSSGQFASGTSIEESLLEVMVVNAKFKHPGGREYVNDGTTYTYQRTDGRRTSCHPDPGWETEESTTTASGAPHFAQLGIDTVDGRFFFDLGGFDSHGGKATVDCDGGSYSSEASHRFVEIHSWAGCDPLRTASGAEGFLRSTKLEGDTINFDCSKSFTVETSNDNFVGRRTHIVKVSGVLKVSFGAPPPEDPPPAPPT